MSSTFSTISFPNIVISTTGAPSNSVGIDGQFAWDSLARVLYGPKSGGVWPAGVGLKGGDILSGAGAPSNSLGNDGDYYFRTNGDWYGPKTGGVWGSPQFNLTGPTGATGPQGPPGGLTARQTTTVTTASVSSGGDWTGTISLAKAFAIVAITLDFPGWLRVYPSAAARTADAARLQNEDPEVPVTAEVATSTVGAETVYPYRSAVLGASQESPPTDTQYLALRNLDSVSRTFSISVLWVAMEA